MSNDNTTGKVQGTEITLEVSGSWSFAIDDLWPDGDAPEPITAAAVVELLKRDGLRNVLRAWCLEPDLEYEVSVTTPNPAWRPENPMFGDPPPGLLVTRCLIDANGRRLDPAQSAQIDTGEHR